MNILNGAGTAQWDTLSTNSIPRRATDEVRDGMVRTSEVLSKLQTYTGERKPETEAVGLNALVADMDPVLQRLSRNLTLEYRLAKGLPRFDGAPKDIRGVILNLVENSIQSLESGRGTVTILTGSEELKPLTVCEAVTGVSLPAGRYVFLQVVDAGSGMDEETYERAFDPFFTTSRVRRGLGLAAVLGSVRSHRGFIHLETERGRGTNTKIFFPVADDWIN